MIAPNRIRRTVRGGVLVAVLILLLAAFARPGFVAGADPIDDPNLLDRPMADAALIPASSDPTVAATTPPLLLTLEAGEPDATSARLDVLRRDDVWRSIASTRVDIGIGHTAQWLVDLGAGRFALIATAPRSAKGAVSAVVIAFDALANRESAAITEVGRQSFDNAIESAGAADVDGFGSAELVLGMRTTYETSLSCGRTSLFVVDGSAGAVRRAIELPGLIGTGVIGRFQSVPGDDLLLYTSADCPPGGGIGARFAGIRLFDGTEIIPESPPSSIARPLFASATEYPQPLRLDLDGGPPHQVIALTGDGLQIIDPSHAWATTQIAPIGSVPLFAGSPREAPFPGTPIAMLDATGDGALASLRLGRDRSGSPYVEGESRLGLGGTEPLRWRMVSSSIQTAAARQMTANAWFGGIVDAACPDLTLPGVIMRCDSDHLRPGPAWLATRPIGALTVGTRRLVLVAAGLDWQPTSGVPASPSPVASGPPGWWRHGPSSTFAIAEIAADDIVSRPASDPAAVTIDPVTTKDGSTTVAGRSGTRLFAALAPLVEGQASLAAAGDARVTLSTGAGLGGRFDVVRLPVSPGQQSGQDDSSVGLTIGDLPGPNGQPVVRWSMNTVLIDDLGEWGQPFAQILTRDATGPTVTLDEPFTSPVWPFRAELGGVAESGSKVRVDGVGDVAVDRLGRFTFETELAPWPQTLRVTATDVAGNDTVSEVSVIGGIDYRRLPWAGIGAAVLLVVVGARGLFGRGAGRPTGIEPTRWSTGSIDDASGPEIEELPPGSGLARG